MPKPAMPPRTKEQIVAQMQREKDVKDKREFVKNKFYPALVKASKSIDDGKFLLGSMSNMVMEQFLGAMKDMKFSDLHLEKKLDPKADNYTEYVELLDIFKDENVFTARELIEGMKNEVQMMVDNELKDRPLTSLKTDFLE